jgi:hypothetical protein
MSFLPRPDGSTSRVGDPLSLFFCSLLVNFDRCLLFLFFVLLMILQMSRENII